MQIMEGWARKFFIVVEVLGPCIGLALIMYFLFMALVIMTYTNLKKTKNKQI